ncbi:hypothetical protein [Lysinibacillus fusiformis]|uniref:hypothetical protein n=1 Tax=Lysinibacillus fusiformis TaxID=28031 RepID=UPI003D00FC53
MYTYRVDSQKKRGRPATGETPKRYIRAGQIWEDCAQLAENRGETMTAFVLRALENEKERVQGEPDEG